MLFTHFSERTLKNDSYSCLYSAERLWLRSLKSFSPLVQVSRWTYEVWQQENFQRKQQQKNISQNVAMQRLSNLRKMFLLGERDVRRALNLEECLQVNKMALISLTQGSGVVPSRLGLPYPKNPNKKGDESNQGEAEDWTLIKPAAYYGEQQCISMGMKVVSVRQKNPAVGLPLVPATICLIDPPSGIVQATISATYVTAMRTSAGPALAVQMFRPDLEHLVIFGAGTQAEAHIELIELSIKRNIAKISIVNRSLERANILRQKLLDQGERVVDVILLKDVDAVSTALGSADVISATTNTTTPLWKDSHVLQKGCLITGIGSYTPEMQEIPKYVVNSAHVVIDTPEAMASGDLKHLGTFESTSHPVSLAGDAFQNPSKIGRSKDCIFYKAVGTAIQDVLTAEAVVKSAKALGIGQEVDMS